MTVPDNTVPDNTGPDVVITGIGIVSPVGGDARSTMDALLCGASGVGLLPERQRALTPVYLHAPVDDAVLTRVSRQEARRFDRSVRLALQAAREAWSDAGSPEAEPSRVASIVSTGMGGLQTVFDYYARFLARGYVGVPAQSVPATMANASAAVIAIEVGARACAVSTAAACASGADAVVDAMHLFRAGEIDVAVVGGTEAVIHPATLAGFASLRALSARHGDPAAASRPFDRDRDGFVIGEGAAVLVLERRAHAAARAARVWGSVLGTGRTCDAYDVVAPDPTGRWSAEAMTRALRCAGIARTDVSFVSAHATATPIGDLAEFKALRTVFGSAVGGIPVTAVKSAIGHLIGASGTMAAALAAISLRDAVVPPTLNLDNLDPEIDLDVVHGKPRYLNGPRAALVNSFGFGGHNLAIVLGAP
jgi:3-oxoacyl-[acyl-carrier-protein] synthase II